MIGIDDFIPMKIIAARKTAALECVDLLPLFCRRIVAVFTVARRRCPHGHRADKSATADKSGDKSPHSKAAVFLGARRGRALSMKGVVESSIRSRSR